MTNPSLSEPLKLFLHEAGITGRTLAKASLDTRLFHDLKLYGDVAEWFFEELKQRGVDLSGFAFEKYFPPEFYGGNTIMRIIYILLPFLGWFRRRSDYYEPVTLRMIEQALEEKKWRV